MIVYYTDGSASPNPGPGGFAVIRDLQPWILGSEDGETTNIRMEGKALIAALQDADGTPCVIYTDSEFWINVVTKWAPGWQQRGWTKKGGEIKNLDIVRELYELYSNSQGISVGCVAMKAMRGMSWRMSGLIGRVKASG